MICANCERHGHVFKDCNVPILSYGILGYKIQNNQLYFLLIQRKDTIGYIDFLRGKYDQNKDKILEILFSEMTQRERERIKTLPFDTLWNELWVNHNSRVFITEKKNSKIKFESVDSNSIIDNIQGKWESQEFCIPKGRKNNKEDPCHCAIREFKEETGISDKNFRINYDLGILSETFIGSNNVIYSHEYLLAEVSNEYIPKLDHSSLLMVGEVRNIQWFNFHDAMRIFRDYDSTKRNIIYNANKIIRKRNRLTS